jgi:hypothetical protein
MTDTHASHAKVPLPVPDIIPHAWGLEDQESFINEFSWPAFDFDLNDALATEHRNDRLLEYMTARLARTDK